VLIDCDSCLARDIHCGDCVITVLLARPAPEFQQSRCTELDATEFAALGSLAAVGLVPPLRLRTDGALTDDGAAPPDSSHGSSRRASA
jgi:hypothetical protein